MKTIFLTAGITMLVCYLIYELIILAIVANNGIISKTTFVDYKKSLESLTVNLFIKNVLQSFTSDGYMVISNCPSLLFSYFSFSDKGVFGVLRWSKAHKITKAKFDDMYNNDIKKDNRELLLERED